MQTCELVRRDLAIGGGGTALKEYTPSAEGEHARAVAIHAAASLEASSGKASATSQAAGSMLDALEDEERQKVAEEAAGRGGQKAAATTSKPAVLPAAAPVAAQRDVKATAKPTPAAVSSAAPAPAPAPAIAPELVIKYMGQQNERQQLVLHIQDCGGQDVFLSVRGCPFEHALMRFRAIAARMNHPRPPHAAPVPFTLHQPLYSHCSLL